MDSSNCVYPPGRDIAKLPHSELTLKRDFSHHLTDLVRLNHQSFGAPPQSVVTHQNELRQAALEDPDWFLHPANGNLKKRLTTK